jgi:lipopolysaccharide export system permease protein
MSILFRYISRSVAMNMAIVLVVLLAIFTFFGFLAEISHVGKGNYTLTKAFIYSVLAIPNLTYQLFPVTALVGTTLGLGLMASHSELIAIRSAGVSLRRIVWTVTQVGIIVAVVAIILGEWIAPKTERYAQTIRSVAMSKPFSVGGGQGLWAKDGLDIVNIRSFLPGERFGEIYIYKLNEKYEITKLIYAKTASYIYGNWLLEDIKSSIISTDKVVSSSERSQIWNTTLSPDLVNVVKVKPTTLSARGLYQYVNYLKLNGLNADRYEQALWTKFAVPFVSIVMVLLAVPFVFGSLRSVTIGQRILVGVLAGVGYHLFNKMFSFFGMVYELNPILTALFPTLLATIAAFFLIRRVR